jgi:hypothetical protein
VTLFHYVNKQTEDCGLIHRLIYGNQPLLWSSRLQRCVEFHCIFVKFRQVIGSPIRPQKKPALPRVQPGVCSNHHFMTRARDRLGQRKAPYRLLTPSGRLDLQGELSTIYLDQPGLCVAFRSSIMFPCSTSSLRRLSATLKALLTFSVS